MADQKVDKKPLSLEAAQVKKSIDTMLGQVGKQTESRLQQGQNNNQILKELLGTISSNPKEILKELSEAEIPIPKSQVGLPGTIKGATQGELVSPFTQRTEPRGREDAIKLLKDALAVAETLKTPEEKAKEKETISAATTRGTKKAEREIKLGEFESNLQDYFALAGIIPTGEGIERFKVAAQVIGKKVTQSDSVGIAAAQLENFNKKLRVDIARLKDVGNLSVVEQDAAEMLLFKFTDSTGLRELKKATLQDIARAQKEGEPSAIKKLVKSWMATDEFKEEKIEQEGSDEEAYQQYLKLTGGE